MIINRKPLVSIIIPVYNGANYLNSAIESALRQTYDNIEIVIVNDGSDDSGRTEQIALSYGDKVKYHSKENGGVSTALNLAVKVMEGEYFSWLSHDDLYRDDKIEAELEEIRKCGDKMKIVYSNYSTWEVHTNSMTSSKLETLYPVEQLENGCFPVFMGTVSGCTLLFHRDHFSRAGLFKEELDTTQDYDMWFRIFQGHNTKFITSPLVTVRSHAEQGSRTKKHHELERDQLHLEFMRRLADEEKKRVFGGDYQFYCTVIDKYRRWNFPQSYREAKKELLRLAEDMPDCEEKLQELSMKIFGMFPQECKEFFLFGAGRIGRSLLFVLRLRRIAVKGFIDNDVRKHGQQVDGLICSPLSEVSRDAGIIVAIKENREKIVSQLKEAGYHNIIPEYSGIEGLFRGAPIDKSRLEETD